jgi:outer membrane protein insertion porin family/translocation and assembly module TamA
VEIHGAHEIGARELRSKIATRASPRFLGVFPEFIYDPAILNPFVLEQDLRRIQRYYQSRGFYAAIVRQGLVEYEDPFHARVRIDVQENTPTLIQSIELTSNASLEPATAQALHAALAEHLHVGDRFEEKAYVEAESAIREVLMDAGYAHAAVLRSARVAQRRQPAEVHFTVTPGQQSVLGKIRLHGLGSLPEEPVRRALSLEPGSRFSSSELRAAQQAALELGVFSSVDVRPRLESEPSAPGVVPIDVRLTPAQLQTVRLGGGLQLDTLRTDVHLLAGWDHGNFLGGLRRLSLDVRPGIVLYPTRLDQLTLPEHYLPELRLLATLRQPGFLEARTTGSLRAAYDIYSVLDALSDGTNILGYREAKLAGVLERPFGPHLRVQLSQNVQTNTPFAYVGEVGAGLNALVISHTELLPSIDFRDQILSPQRGVRLLFPLQLAGLGGDAADFRLQPELTAFVPLGSDWVWGLRASIGMLFPFNYAQAARSGRDAQILFFRGFFAGGPTSNRGYPPRGIGPHGPLPFLYIDGMSRCDAAQTNPNDCVVPLGGFTLWEASSELRYSLEGPLDLALFCDTADVSEHRSTFTFARPHLSCGPGVRYATPVGPLRLDLGVRVPGLQNISGPSAEPEAHEMLGMPIAIALGIGQAF